MTWAWLRDGVSESPRPTTVPLVIYVLWHPSFADGPMLAREIAAWCGNKSSDQRAAGMGIPVYFRSVPWTAESALDDRDVPPPAPSGEGPDAERARDGHVFRRPIDLCEATHNVFVPLVDDHMIDDLSWRRDLIELGRRHRTSPRVRLAPIQISSAWSRLPSVVNEIQPLAIRRWNDPVESPAERAERWRVRIRRLLTQALVRLMRSIWGASDGAALPSQVFLSHAKADDKLGPGVAERLRDVAAGYGQIDVFYDENDLPSGFTWEQSMLGAARESAGFVAVLGDAYTSRYWCRREVQLARTPVPASTVSAAARDHIWRVRPMVVTVTMDGKWSRLVGDVSAVPAILWKSEESSPTAILDQVFLEALLSEFQVKYAEILHEHALKLAPAPLPVAYATWTLDSTTLLRLYPKLRKQLPEHGLIVYPGQGFFATEEEELTASLPEYRFVCFDKFARLVGEHGCHDWDGVLAALAATDAIVPMRDRPLVALSAGDSDDLAMLGYDAIGRSSMHLDTVVLRVCRTLLEEQARLAYGGVLRDGKSFTALLHDIVLAMASERGAAPIDDLDPDPITPLESWVAKPYEWRNPVETRAKLARLCRHQTVGEAVPEGASDLERARAIAAGLVVVRKTVAARTTLTLALAGKRWGFNGYLPGVAEEVLCAWEAGGPGRVVLLGEFGGAARELVRAILGRTEELPAALTFAGQLAHPEQKLANLVFGDAALYEQVERRYADLAVCLRELRAFAQDRSSDAVLGDALGIDTKTWLLLMRSQSVGYIQRVLRSQIVPRLRARMAVPR